MFEIERTSCFAARFNTAPLLDDVDAPFGNCDEVLSAHDRHANIVTSYLLQRIEDSRGPVFLTTNRRQHIDAAFMARIR